jgi:hypothetical protein
VSWPTAEQFTSVTYLKENHQSCHQPWALE